MVSFVLIARLREIVAWKKYTTYDHVDIFYFQCYGGFPVSRTHVNFTRINDIEAMYGRSHVNLKVEPRSTFT